MKLSECSKPRLFLNDLLSQSHIYLEKGIFKN